jgi:hypothetical protein
MVEVLPERVRNVDPVTSTDGVAANAVTLDALMSLRAASAACG